MISLEAALHLGESSARELFKNYQNPGIATMLSLVGFDRTYVSGSGTVIKDSLGNEYLDFLAGYGSLNLGHNPERVLKAVEAVNMRPNILQLSINPISAALAHNLALVAPGALKRTFFCNSGTEAVEGALKLARAATGKKSIIYCQNSFHGKTMGSLSVTGRKKYRKEFVPLVPNCIEIPFGDANALEKKLKDNSDIAAFILEPIQGEGGINVPPEGYLRDVRRICSKYDVLLILDEVQTGLARTGKMFACQHEDVVPDILCLAKSLGGGVMPIGAFITTDSLWEKAYGGIEKSTLHTSTFGGNTRAAAAGLATLQEIIENDLASAAAEKGSYILEKINSMKEKYPLLKDVRGKGLLIGLEFAEPSSVTNKLTGRIAGKLAQEYVGAIVAGDLYRHGKVLTAYTLNNPNVIRLEPPLTVSFEEIDKMLQALDLVLKKNSSTAKAAFSGIRNAITSKLHAR